MLGEGWPRDGDLFPKCWYFLHTMAELAANEDEITVLVIEDNEELQQFIAEKLSNVYSCQATGNGLEGLKLAKETIPDIIITDWMMPGMKGIDLVNDLKSNPETSHIPIIMLTARDTIDDKLAGLTKGADEYLTKPFVIEELLVRCANILKSRTILRRKWISEFMLSPSPTQVVDRDGEFLQQLKSMIQENMTDPQFSVSKLQELMGLSRMALHRKLKKLTQHSPVELIRAMRMEKAKELFDTDKGIAVSEVAYRLGFSDPSYFTKCFKQYFGHLPASVNP